LVLKREWLSGIISGLAQMNLETRSKIPGLERGREDIILGGAVIVEKILDYFHLPEFIVTDAGLLEGLLLDSIEKERGLPPSLTTGLTWRLQKR
jgi:exopolyphosphatase/guanosine-5'-triphosphate,3'-diphosphate pyrophosphatase